MFCICFKAQIIFQDTVLFLIARPGRGVWAFAVPRHHWYHCSEPNFPKHPFDLWQQLSMWHQLALQQQSCRITPFCNCQMIELWLSKPGPTHGFSAHLEMSQSGLGKSCVWNGAVKSCWKTEIQALASSEQLEWLMPCEFHWVWWSSWVGDLQHLMHYCSNRQFRSWRQGAAVGVQVAQSQLCSASAAQSL